MTNFISLTEAVIALKKGKRITHNTYPEGSYDVITNEVVHAYNDYEEFDYGTIENFLKQLDPLENYLDGWFVLGEDGVIQTQPPNGLTSFLETYYEVVAILERERGREDRKMPEFIRDIQHSQGSAGFYETANDLTREFEVLNKGRQWDGEFTDEIYVFIYSKINP